MASHKQVTLRPPPNVDFVHGYPGISPGPGRGPAEVMGSVEIRFGKEGVKTKWVRVAMRKVEVLPGGISPGTSPDFIGQSPQDLWVAPGDYEVLISKDFHFRFHLPEIIPPSVSLEKGAGIRYELVASVCVKGKRGILRKDSSAILEDISVVQIDKHELHSIWPIYNQPDTRTVPRDQLSLTAFRTQSCFSPGERLSVTATLHSNSFNATNLRAFEFLLLETVTFRGAKTKANKGVQPQVKVTPLGERNIPVNATLFGGMRHVVELGCVIPPDHPNVTINTARHIDVGYKVVIKAVIDHIQPLVIELPVTLSNWQRNVSLDIVNRIGYAHNLSVGPPPSASLPTTVLRENSATAGIAAHPQHTLPTEINAAVGSTPATNEFGQLRPQSGYQASTQPAHRPTLEAPITRPFSATVSGPAPSNEAHELIPDAAPPVSSAPPSVPEAPQERPVSAVPNRFTVANLDDRVLDIRRNGLAYDPPSPEAPSSAWPSAEEEKTRMRQAKPKPEVNVPPSPEPASRISSPPPPNKQWLTAEEEKRKLYENAVIRAAKMQEGITDDSSSPVPSASSAASSPPPKRAASKRMQWQSAEDEKRRLFESARENVRRHQGSFPEAESSSRAAGNPHTQESPAIPRPITSTAAEMYSNAMKAIQVSTPSNKAQPVPAAPARGKDSSTKRDYMTAEEEKAALRYKQAMEAVKRNYGEGPSSQFPDGPAPSSSSGDPISYDELFPSPPKHAPPNSFSGVASGSRSVNSVTRSSPDSQSYVAPGSPATSLRQNSLHQRASLPPPPLFNGQNGATMPLSAVEEKARLKARFEAEDGDLYAPPNFASAMSSSTRPGMTDASSSSRDPSISLGKQKAFSEAPPPLMPRPPVHYIEETQATDARIQHQIEQQESPHRIEGHRFNVPWIAHPQEDADLASNIRPFGVAAPPLPPKIPMS